MYWADQSAAAHYHVKDLTPEDAQRAPGRTRGKAKEDWQVSRALLHAVRQAPPVPGVMSLSHSHGHALCAKAPLGWSLGVDLERMRPRDFSSLGGWICSAQEASALSALTGQEQAEWFYLLWTLKEAFIKAAGLNFPADMASVGLTRDAQGRWRLRAPSGEWRASSWRVGSEWMASAVWSQAGGDATCPQWRTPTACALPVLTQLDIWLP